MVIDPAEAFLIELSKEKALNQNAYFSIQRKIAREYKVQFFKKDKLLKTYHNLVENNTIKQDQRIERLLRLKNTRSGSGIVVVSVLTKPYECPGNCLYCPTEDNVPKSYLKDEPAVMRAIACQYDPYLQVKSRLRALEATGHKTDKINIRVIGATWSYYQKAYQTWFIKMCFSACNDSSNKNRTLTELQRENETSKNRIVEISIETRQDYLNKAEIKRLRMLGVTKVELGVQSIFDDVLKLNNRGHDDSATIKATKMLKDAGFKVSYQMMANLPGSNLERDEKMFLDLFNDSKYKPDYLKIYPLALVKEAPIYKLYLEKKFKPYNGDELKNLIKNIKISVPYFVRIERVIRDIPADYIVEGGAKISNLRQIVANELAKEHLICRCIRCREVKETNIENEPVLLFREDYEASGGKEIFLSFENIERTKLYSMLRLRIPSQYFEKKMHFLPVLNKAALIREMHTYGQQISINEKSKKASQHKGYGKKLLAEAERIASEEFSINKIAIISGVGVREYFRKLGYELEETYMIKKVRS